MTDQLTSTGLTIDSLEDRIAAIKARIRSSISANIPMSIEDPVGQLVEILAESIQNLAELAQVVHTAFDPAQATGNLLSSLCALTGTIKRAATQGTVTLTVDLDGGTVLPAGSIASVATDPTNQWATDTAVTAPAGPAASYTVAATAVEAGEYIALAGTITTIVTAVVGWNSVTNLADATPGQEIEEDPDLRERRDTEVFLSGSTSVEAIQADVSAIDGIISCKVYENNSTIPDGLRPPHSFEVTLWDGSPPAVANADIAEAIFEGKPAGIRAYGTTTVAHVDSQGVSHQVGFSRATVVYILVDITINVNNDYAGDSAVETAIAAMINSLPVGAAVRRSDIIHVVEAIDGVEWTDLSAGPLLSRKPAAVGAADIVLTETEKAYIQDTVADITVTSV